MKAVRNAVIAVAVAAVVFLLMMWANQDKQTVDDQSDSQATEATEAVETDGTPGDSAADEDGQNPVMNFVGPYVCDRASMLVEAAGMGGAKVTVSWGSSAWETSEWVIEGDFDPDTLTINYTNATRTDYVYKDNGDVESETVVYSDGTGSISFQDDGALTLTWDDEKEHIADDMVFEFSF